MYTTKQAGDLLGVTPSTVRNYTAALGAFLSPSANGRPRRFTEQDIAVLTRARAGLAEGRTFDQVATDLASVDLGTLTPPTPAEPERQPEPQITALALIDQWELMVRPYQEQAEQLRQERDAAQARVAELERELGRAEGELAQRRRSWWSRLWGR